MSFGFSIGDFLAVAVLIKDIASALHNSAVAEHRELLLELHGLKRALYEVEHLKTVPGEEAAVNAIKVAALTCQYPLEEFTQKLKNYAILGDGAAQTTLDKVKGWGKKIAWNRSMLQETLKLRVYLNVHVGSLNMRLITQNLNYASIIAAKNDETLTAIKDSAANTQRILDNLKSKTVVQNDTQNNSTNLAALLSQAEYFKIFSRLHNFVSLANKVWTANLQLIDILTQHFAAVPTVDSKYMWFQAPLRFEDALGRVIPIPSEYGWKKLEYIILDQFSSGPGSVKVHAGEYELFHSKDRSQIISETTFGLVTPGTDISMAIIIGHYDSPLKKRCPRPGCRATVFGKTNTGHSICTTCSTQFATAAKQIPRPFRLLMDDYDGEEELHLHNRKRKRQTNKFSGYDPIVVLRQIRDERKWFKNVHIQYTDLLDISTLTNTSHLSRRVRIQEEPPEISETCLDASRILLETMEVLGIDMPPDMTVADFEAQPLLYFGGFDSLLLLEFIDMLRKTVDIDKFLSQTDLWEVTFSGLRRLIEDTIAHKHRKVVNV